MTLQEIEISHTPIPGDLGFLIHLHGSIYQHEYNYGVEFEQYVAKGLLEFFENYDHQLDRLWICRHEGQIVGSLALAHRPNHAAQLRYFLIKPAYRGIGLGKKLMHLYMEFLYKGYYHSSYLWTTSELTAASMLYQKSGFALTEEIASDAFGKKVTEQRYDLFL